MSQVTFHFNVPDKLAYACRLLGRVHASGARAAVLAPPALLDALDVELWRFLPLGFLPHCRADAPPAMRAVSPIVLGADAATLETRAVLLQLGDAVPADVERFDRVNELVAPDPADRAQARLRWRHYAERGHGVKSHDVVEGAERHA